jgi:hypothetical protein
MQIGRRALAFFVDHVAAAEAVEAEIGIEGMRFVPGDRPGKAPAGGRRRLEAAIAPAAIEIEIVDVGASASPVARCLRRF